MRAGLLGLWPAGQEAPGPNGGNGVVGVGWRSTFHAVSLFRRNSRSLCDVGPIFGALSSRERSTPEIPFFGCGGSGGWRWHECKFGMIEVMRAEHRGGDRIVAPPSVHTVVAAVGESRAGPPGSCNALDTDAHNAHGSGIKGGCQSVLS